MSQHSPPDHLFEPTLQTETPPTANYSQLSHYLVAFFGGPLAILLFGMMGANRIGQLRKDTVFFSILALAVAVQFAAGYWMLRSGALGPEREFATALRFGNRVLSMVWGLIIIRHYRALDTAADFADLERPNPWGPAVGAMVIAFVATFVVGKVLSHATG